MADKTAPDALSGFTNKEVEAKVATAKSEGHAAGKSEGKAEAEAAAKTQLDAAVVTAKADATKAESERIKAITGLEEAKGRESAALNLALGTKISAEEAKPVLAGLPKAVTGERAGNAPLGIALGTGDKKPEQGGDVYSPDEVAANLNKKLGLRS